MSRPRALRSLADLAAAGLVARPDDPALTEVARRYSVAVTPEVAVLIDRNDPADSLARQFVPAPAELVTAPEERADPIGDHVHSPVRGIVHRYRDRLLLKITHTCPVYCRFCFRREMVGPEGHGDLAGAELEAALGYIAGQTDVFEVIVTGGDPFVLSPRRVADLTGRLAAMPHIRVIRWHTRVPVVSPAKVTPELVRALRPAGAVPAIFVAVHANHAREFSPAAATALARLADAGIALVSQSVLLRGVNDTVGALEALMRAFLAHRVKPYYLHHGDLAPGTGHFRVPMAEGLALMEALRTRVSGLAMPAYVVDLPGGYGKVPVASGVAGRDGTVFFTDRSGGRHVYPPEKTTGDGS